MSDKRYRPHVSARPRDRNHVELWTTRTPETGTVERHAARAETAGWDGITFTDSQTWWAGAHS